MISIAQRCHYCSRSRSPQDILHLPGGVKMCALCQERHAAGVLAMSGLKAHADGTFSTAAPPPPECSECNLSAEELRLRSGFAELTMAIHFENGIYRFLCAACDAAYVPKRKDLYADTSYGYAKGLK